MLYITFSIDARRCLQVKITEIVNGQFQLTTKAIYFLDMSSVVRDTIRTYIRCYIALHIVN